MFRSKYSTFLTVTLIVVIIIIIIIAIIFSIKAYHNYKEDRDKDKAIAEFQQVINEEYNEQEEDPEEELIMPVVASSETEETSGGTTRKRTVLYKNYPMIGYIEISKINLKYPILSDKSPEALDVAVSVMYPSNPKLNEPGNTVIIGHNYKNGKFFSNNKKLIVGDKIKITDLSGKTLTYTIYEMMTISETDTEFITRDRGDNIEISLSTCTDDAKARLVILARAD